MKNNIKAIFNWLGYDVVKLRNSNADLSGHLLNVFAAKKIDCVLDVGANSGQYGKFLRDLGFTGYIVSFEPVKSVFLLLQENANSPVTKSVFGQSTPVVATTVSMANSPAMSATMTMTIATSV